MFHYIYHSSLLITKVCFYKSDPEKDIVCFESIFVSMIDFIVIKSSFILVDIIKK